MKKTRQVAMSRISSAPDLAAGRALPTSPETGARSDTSTSTMSTVESEMSKLQNQYSRLKQRYRRLKSKNKTSLKAQLQKANKEISDLKVRVSELEAKNPPKDPYDVFPIELLQDSKSEFLPYKLKL